LIIDMRSRPPFGCFLNTNLFDNETEDKLSPHNFAKRFGMQFAQSARERSMELYLKEMEKSGITTAVVPMRKKQKGDNDTLVQLLKQYPGKFVALAGINPTSGDDALQEIKQYVLDGPCQGIIMEPAWLVKPIFANDTQIYPIYQFCQENKIPVCLSYGGFHSGTVEYNNPIYIDMLLSDFPKLKLALCHAAWPWVGQAVHLAYKYDNAYLSPDIYAIHAAGGIEYLNAANYMLYDKIMYGSAYPIVDMEGSVRYYQAGFLREEILPNVLYSNAKVFLNL